MDNIFEWRAKKAKSIELIELEKKYRAETFSNLAKLKKQKYGNIDISLPMSDAERLLNEVTASKASELNQQVIRRGEG